jgi:hypothetical protein
MLTILFIAVAAIMKAAADTMTHHFSSSVFRWKDPRFWDPSVSWMHAPLLRWTRYRLDAWHLANSLMVVCFAAAAVFHEAHLRWYWELLIAGVIYNVTFNRFYNKILRR